MAQRVDRRTEKPDALPNSDAGSNPWCGRQGLIFSQGQLSGQTPGTGLRHPAFLGGRCQKAMLGVGFQCRLSYGVRTGPHVQSHALTSVYTLQIPGGISSQKTTIQSGYTGRGNGYSAVLAAAVGYPVTRISPKGLMRY